MSLRILITNDDGIDAPGIAVMREIARELSDDVWVVAPDGNQSGAGHRFTFGRELGLEERAPRVFAVVGGSPADCVVAGMTHLLKRPAARRRAVGRQQRPEPGRHHQLLGHRRRRPRRRAAGRHRHRHEPGRQLRARPRGRLGQCHAASAPTSSAASSRAAQRPRHLLQRQFPVLRRPTRWSASASSPHQRFSRSPLRYYPSDNAGKFFIAIPETPLPLDPAARFPHAARTRRAITVTPMRPAAAGAGPCAHRCADRATAWQC